MGDLNIYTLVMMVRGFNNEVTVNWLASKLGISYSTLARCKNGVWPRSVTFDAMRGVYDECRDRFFGGDGDALVESALGYLDRQGIVLAELVEASEKGYDAFLSALISIAHSSQVEAVGDESVSDQDQLPHGEGKSEVEVRVTGAQTGADGGQRGYSGVVVALPVAAILLFGLLNVPLASLFDWAEGDKAAFAAMLLAVAVSPVVAGACIDAPLAWRAYRKANPDAEFTWRSAQLVSKYGGADEVMPGAGRFDLSRRHCEYQALCNVLGALCSISLLGFLSALPDFSSFFAAHEWTELFKVGIAVGFFVAYSHNREHRLLPSCEHIGDEVNPDNYLPSRAHVWANALHLVVTFSLVCILTLSMLAFSVAHFREFPAPLLILWPFAQTIVFLAYEGISPAAEKAEALGVGAFVPGAIASSVGVMLLVLVCYLPSWEGAAVCLVCVACFSGALLWRHVSASKKADWVQQGRRSGAYSMIVVVALAVMLVIEIASTAFA